MKKILLFGMFVSTLFFIHGCCRNGKTFPVKNKNRLRFNENDTFIYKSNYNNYDTLYISAVEEGKNDQYIHEGLCAGKTFYQQKVTWYYQSYPVPFSEDDRPYLMLTNNSDVITFRSSFYRNEFKNSGGYGFFDYIGDYFAGDSVYSDAEYLLLVDTANRELIFKYFFNKEYGFLSYEFQDGEKFDLFQYKPFE